MNAEQIRAEMAKVIARDLVRAESGNIDPADRHYSMAESALDALTAAGLLPTGPIVGWAVAERPTTAGLPPNIDDVFALGERAAADEWRVQADEYFDGRHPHRVYEVREVTE